MCEPFAMGAPRNTGRAPEPIARCRSFAGGALRGDALAAPGGQTGA